MSRWKEILKDGFAESDFDISPDDSSVDFKKIWESDLDNKEGSVCGDLNQDTPEGMNFINGMLAKTTGLFNGLSFIQRGERILDIGCGHGAIGKLLEQNAVVAFGDFHIRELDIVKRFDNCELIDGTGNLDSIDSESVHRVFCSNVLQHLSKKQRAKYFEEIHRVLVKNGTFNFGTMLSNRQDKSSKSFYNGISYCFSVKYCTPYLMEDELNSLIIDRFRQISVANRCDGYVSYCLQKI